MSGTPEPGGGGEHGPRSAVVTGLGVAAPTGLGVEAYWPATLRGEAGIGRLTRFDPGQYPAQLAGECRDFVAEEHIPARLIPQTDPMTRLALAATDWALDDAGLDPAQTAGYGAGVMTASSSGGFEFGQRELENLWSKGGQYVSAYQSFAWFYAVNTGQISIRHGLRGPSGVVVTDQAGGLDAVAHARRNIRGGAAVMVTGAVDSSLCPWSWAAHLAGGGLTTQKDPKRAFLPFDANASGYVPGEGGAILVVEELDAARKRGAKHVVFADGYGIPELDLVEANAIRDVFGPYGVPVTAPKTMTGRLYAGGAALDLAAAVLTIRDSVIPPTTNVSAPAPGCLIDLVVGKPRPARVDAALVLARGRGGFNAAMVLTRAD